MCLNCSISLAFFSDFMIFYQTEVFVTSHLKITELKFFLNSILEISHFLQFAHRIGSTGRGHYLQWLWQPPHSRQIQLQNQPAHSGWKSEGGIFENKIRKKHHFLIYYFSIVLFLILYILSKFKLKFFNLKKDFSFNFLILLFRSEAFTCSAITEDATEIRSI